MRQGDWMQAYSGHQFWPIDPRPEEVCIEDIGHALSCACRYAGHCERFYSVAEHSVYVSMVVPPEDALAGLLHDAPEAYIADIVRPAKRFITGYEKVEARLWEAIAARFGLATELPDSVKEADNTVLLAEQKQIMKPPPQPWNIPGEPADVTIVGMMPEQAKQFFMERFWELV
jgi:uncharacterized protein